MSYGTTNNKLVCEIRDSVGDTISDVLYSALTLEMNTTTKQISCFVPHFLFVNGLNVMNEIGLKANTSALSSLLLQVLCLLMF